MLENDSAVLDTLSTVPIVVRFCIYRRLGWIRGRVIISWLATNRAFELAHFVKKQEYMQRKSNLLSKLTIQVW